MALGTREFVLQLQLGGTFGRVVDEKDVAKALREMLVDKGVGLVMLEAKFVKNLPEDLYEQAFYSRTPEVVALGGKWNEVLRGRIRQVTGTDMLAPRGKT